MPNHIQNRLFVQGQPEAVMNYIKGQGVRIDFNTIIAMPECLKNYNPYSHIITAVEKKYQTALNPNALIASMQALNREKQKINFEGEEQKAFERGCKNFEETGYVSWYEWSIANWNTKWNAYGTPDSRDTDDTIYFQTAWSNVSDLIKKLSGFFSSSFFYEWADEDIGSNAGRAVARGGNLVINRAQGRKAYELAFDLNPGLKDQFKYVDGKYEFIV